MSKYTKYLGFVSAAYPHLEYWEELERKNEVVIVQRPDQYLLDVYAPQDSKLKSWDTAEYKPPCEHSTEAGDGS